MQLVLYFSDYKAHLKSFILKNVTVRLIIWFTLCTDETTLLDGLLEHYGYLTLVKCLSE